MEENNFTSGGGYTPYPAYQPYGHGGGLRFAPVSPEEKRAIKKNYSGAFWQAVIHSIGSLVLANIIFVAMTLSGYEFRLNDEGTQIIDTPYAIAAMLPSIVFCISLFLFDKGSSKNKLSDYFRSDRITAGTVFGFFGILMLVYTICIILQQILLTGCFAAGFSPIKEEYLSEDDLSVAYLVWDFVLGSLLAPIGEELFFRGVILRRLSTVSQRFAIFVSALIFGMMHGNLLQTILGFGIGVVFAYTAVKTGSLILPIAGHIFINTAALSSTVVTYLTDEDTANAYWLGLLGVFFVLGMAALIIVLLKKKISFPRSTEYHSKRTFPIMFACVSFWVMAAVYVIDIVTKFGPVTDKLLE